MLPNAILRHLKHDTSTGASAMSNAGTSRGLEAYPSFLLVIISESSSLTKMYTRDTCAVGYLDMASSLTLNYILPRAVPRFCVAYPVTYPTLRTCQLMVL